MISIRRRERYLFQHCCKAYRLEEIKIRCRASSAIYLLNGPEYVITSPLTDRIEYSDINKKGGKKSKQVPVLR